MSDPYLDALEQLDQMRDRAFKAEAAITRVRELHRTGPGEPTPGGSICWGCGGTWPCPTIKALDGLVIYKRHPPHEPGGGCLNLR